MILNISIEAWIINIAISIWLWRVGFGYHPSKADRQVDIVMGQRFFRTGKNWPVRATWFLHIVVFVLCVWRLCYLGISL